MVAEAARNRVIQKRATDEAENMQLEEFARKTSAMKDIEDRQSEQATMMIAKKNREAEEAATRAKELNERMEEDLENFHEIEEVASDMMECDMQTNNVSQMKTGLPKNKTFSCQTDKAQQHMTEMQSFT